ncbi:type IV toxin-antitoxin system AbiEi family antitoxin domain-containing protein [Nocardioides mangrovicus]
MSRPSTGLSTGSRCGLARGHGTAQARDMATDLSDLLIDGVLLTREALAMGVEDKELTKAVRAGVLTRIRHGGYAATAEWNAAGPDRRHQLRYTAVLRLYGSHVALSHVSAVVAVGGPTWGMSTDLVHLTHLTTGSARKVAGVCHHRGRCDRDELIWNRTHWVTNGARTVLDVVATESFEVALVVACYFLHEGFADKEELLGRSISLRREWPSTLRAPLVLSLADERIESVGEARCWYLFWRSDFSMPVPQHKVYDHRGTFLGRVDFVWPDLGVIIEFDGAEKYLRYRRPGESVVDAVIRERRRENRIQEATGWDVIRLTWADLAYPDLVVERIEAVIARRARR